MITCGDCGYKAAVRDTRTCRATFIIDVEEGGSRVQDLRDSVGDKTVICPICASPTSIDDETWGVFIDTVWTIQWLLQGHSSN